MKRPTVLTLLLAAAVTSLLLSPSPYHDPVLAQCRNVPTPDPFSTACDVVYAVTVEAHVLTGSGTPSPVAGANVSVRGFMAGCSATTAPDGVARPQNCYVQMPCDCLELKVEATGFHPWRQEQGAPGDGRLYFEARLVPTGTELALTPGTQTATASPTATAAPVWLPFARVSRADPGAWAGGRLVAQ